MIQMNLHSLHGYCSLDMWMWVIIFQTEVFKFEAEDILHLRIDPHCGQFPELPRQLKVYLIDMVIVDVGIAEGVDEISWLVAANLCNHHCKQGVGGDIERDAQKDISTALIELAGQFAIGNVELEEGVAGGKRCLSVGYVF